MEFLYYFMVLSCQPRAPTVMADIHFVRLLGSLQV
jgi:hypothetical protein